MKQVETFTSKKGLYYFFEDKKTLKLDRKNHYSIILPGPLQSSCMYDSVRISKDFKSVIIPDDHYNSLVETYSFLKESYDKEQTNRKMHFTLQIPMERKLHFDEFFLLLNPFKGQLVIVDDTEFEGNFLGGEEYHSFDNYTIIKDAMKDDLLLMGKYVNGEVMVTDIADIDGLKNMLITNNIKHTIV